jgi:hypothetical protein
MYHLSAAPHPSSALGIWAEVAGPFTEVIGWTFFGDIFLRNPADGYFAVLIPSPPKFVALRYHDREAFEGEFLQCSPFLERRLRRSTVETLQLELGTPAADEIFVSSAWPKDEEDPAAYRKVSIRNYAAAAAARHNLLRGTGLTLLLRHLRWHDDPELWRAVTDHVLGQLDKTACTLVQIGSCSHWLRPHQTRWRADGGFAWPSGYGSGTGGFSRSALPQFDWSVFLVWKDDHWQIAAEKSVKPGLRLAVPSRTTRHKQAAIHTVWMVGREKERRFYGFRRRDDGWHCTAETEWAEDRPKVAR